MCDHVYFEYEINANKMILYFGICVVLTEHNEELNDLYCSPNIVRVIISRRMRGAGHVARMGERRVVYRVLMGKPEGKKTIWETQAYMGG